ncbi:MAG: oligosaccharide flippase family protein [Bacteroidales bacterium]|nr:oligosaccharide flippase family protein [Bacteroidales bacterium]
MNFFIEKITKSNLVKGTFVYAISDGINKAIPFLILPIIVRFLTPEDYGIITNFMIFVQIMSIFAYGAAQGSVPVKFFKLDKQNFQGYIVSLISICFVVLIFFTVLFLFLKNEFEEIMGVPVGYQFLTIVEVFFGVFTCINMLLWRCEEKPIKFGVFQISQTILNIFFTIWFVVYLKWAWEGKILANLIAICVMGIINIVILFYRGYYRFKINFKHAAAVLSFALPLIPHALALWGKTGVDKILITNLEGLSENGLYSTAITWSAIITILITSFGNAYNPYLLKKLASFDKTPSEDNHIKEKKKIVKLSYMFIVGLACFVLCSYFIFYGLIIYIYPESYHSSTRFLSWLMLGEFFRGCYLIYINFIHYTLNTKILGLMTFSLSIIQIGLSYILILKIGTIGAAISTCVISLATAVCVGLYSNKVYPMPWLLKK